MFMNSTYGHAVVNAITHNISGFSNIASWQRHFFRSSRGIDYLHKFKSLLLLSIALASLAVLPTFWNGIDASSY